MQYCEMSKEELLKLKEELDETYKEAQSKGLSLNMSRGKPSATQLNITMDMLDTINSSFRYEVRRWNRLQKLRCSRWYSGSLRSLWQI